MAKPSRTIVVFGDQLNRRIGALADADPDTTTVLLVESEELLAAGRHRQRNHLVVAAMRRFAAELDHAGFTVDRRRAATFRAGIESHRSEYRPDELIATEPNSRGGRSLCRELEIEQHRSNQFLCHHNVFAAWANERSNLKMEDFYRWNRSRLGYLMDRNGDRKIDGPAGGRWNFDHDNREPPPDDPSSVFASPPISRLDDLDHEVLVSLPRSTGHQTSSCDTNMSDQNSSKTNSNDADPVGIWPTSRRAALARLNHFLNNNLENFGRYEDAMTKQSWHLAHSLLSPALNIGLLLPGEVCDAIEERYQDGRVPINSAEGVIRQIIGWREYVWGLYWLWPGHAESNALNHHRELPPMFIGEAPTDMACLADTFAGLNERAWVHHIPRLMLLSNMANLYGIHPRRILEWMSDRYIDAAEWVMVPNVMGMALWADGGRMATKPYVSGGSYINRMSDYCSSCKYNPRNRVGDDACPFTTLYWDFLARHRDRLKDNHRMARPLANLDRLSDLSEVREQADRTIAAIGEGRA